MDVVCKIAISPKLLKKVTLLIFNFFIYFFIILYYYRYLDKEGLRLEIQLIQLKSMISKIQILICFVSMIIKPLINIKQILKIIITMYDIFLEFSKDNGYIIMKV
jgi:hypothetical protein